MNKSAYKILVVEDEEPLRTAYDIILSSKGYFVIPAENGRAALQKLAEQSVDVILLDLFMPVMDGKQFLENINLKDYPDMKIVMCSNVSDTTTIENMKDLGIHRHVLKASILPDDLVAIVDEIVAPGSERQT